jgi:hypothetical protein
MAGKRLQHWVRSALGVHRPSQAGVQAPDGHAHGLGALLDAVPATPGVLAHEIGNRFQPAQRLSLHRLDFFIVVEHRLKLALPAAQAPDGLSLVQPKVPLLNDLRRPGSRPGKGPRLQCQGQRVNRLPWWMRQKPGDIRSAFLVLEGRVPAFKGEVPETQLSAQGILRAGWLVGLGGLSYRFHISCHSLGGKAGFPI